MEGAVGGDAALLIRDLHDVKIVHEFIANLIDPGSKGGEMPPPKYRVACHIELFGDLVLSKSSLRYELRSELLVDGKRRM
jgi:hypothetical protein